jgi:hypothetical protein
LPKPRAKGNQASRERATHQDKKISQGHTQGVDLGAAKGLVGFPIPRAPTDGERQDPDTIKRNKKRYWGAYGTTTGGQQGVLRMVAEVEAITQPDPSKNVA